MEKYVSCFSAARHWNIPYLDDVLGSEYIEKHSSGKIDITVTDSCMNYEKNGYIRHLCEKNLPRGSVIRNEKDFIASPELTFLELANELSIYRLILLGLQMCAYSPGNAYEAVSTKRKLEAFLRKLNGFRCQNKAALAVKYIRNGSASIMESLAFMMLTLPHLQGGYGLNGAYFNREIPLDAKAKRQLGQNRCFADLFYEKEKLAIEYDSYAYHSNPSAQAKDLVRVATLERQGIDVIRIGTKQLYDKNAFKEVAQNIAARLGKRIRIRSKGFNETHEELRKLLPSQTLQS